MTPAGSPIITDYDGEDYTKITFKPDLSLFHQKTLTQDMISLFHKRVIDLAGVLDKKVKISFNGKRVLVESFLQYTELYKLDGEPKRVHEIVNNRWEIVATISDGQFVQASFVNGICTSRGGTHVNLVADQLAEKAMEIIKKKHKDIQVKHFQVRAQLALFINCLIENPSFDSQTKETLTTRSEDFGSECVLSDKFIKGLVSSGLIEAVVAQAKARQRTQVQKALSGRKSQILLGIPKLEDANLAGTKSSTECRLILTEGDSAKALAMAGLAIVGRDKFGVFPLRGKLLNVREAGPQQLKNNAEISALVKILGLTFDRTYEDVAALRYGGIMIMADQDYDGSHIKGLIINFLQCFWPSLLKVNGFVKEFVTPVVKAGRTGDKNPESFFALADFRKWLEQNQDQKLQVKYYKGLGTSTDKEAREYFSNLSTHVLTFKHSGKTDDEKIELAFGKNRADDRKKWVEECRLQETLDHRIKTLTYTDFVDKELVQFSVASNIRAIPSIIDGLKPGQRKVLFGCFKRGLKQELKVAQLAGYVAEHSAYHHGENSLTGTIIGLAQDFVGSNNIPLLVPVGQFGTRALGGKDAASARYIFTKLSPLTRALFPELDDALLPPLEDDGQAVEPEFYVPILPVALINGSVGIGTGWSTTIPTFDPIQILSNIRKQMNGQSLVPLTPWYFGWRGTIQTDAERSYTLIGVYSKQGEDTIDINELPPGVWTSDYKEFLEGLMVGDSAIIAEMRELHSRGTVCFRLRFKEGVLKKISNELVKKLKLSTSLSMRNMVMFNTQGTLKRYETAEQILEEFYPVRLELYSKRKAHMLTLLRNDLVLLSNRVRFIDAVINSTIEIRDRPKNEIEAELTRLQFATLGEPSEQSYEYLLGMKLWTLTREKIISLREAAKLKQEEIEELERTDEKTLWERDLNRFEQLYKEESSKRMIELLGSDLAGRNNIPSIGSSGPGKKSSLEIKKMPKVKKQRKRTSEEADEVSSELSPPKKITPNLKKRSPQKALKSFKSMSSSEDEELEIEEDSSERKPKRKIKRIRKRKRDSRSESENDDIVALKDLDDSDLELISKNEGKKVRSRNKKPSDSQDEDKDEKNKLKGSDKKKTSLSNKSKKRKSNKEDSEGEAKPLSVNKRRRIMEDSESDYSG